MGFVFIKGVNKFMARFCSLFSSSSGNSTYIGTSSEGYLVDIGVSFKKLKEACDYQNIDLSSIKGVFITHEHSDHVKGLKAFLSKYNVPVYSSKSTIESICSCGLVPVGTDCRIIDGEESINSVGVKSFRTSHDTPVSQGYTFILPDERQISVCTDLGEVTDGVLDGILKSDLVLIESNHDLDMLRMGPYPYPLKKRIMSQHGHLSNTSCAETATKLLQKGTTRFVLGHLSRENNTPDKAYKETFDALDMCGARINIDYTLTVAGDMNKMILL